MLKVKINDIERSFDHITFSGGEEHIRIKDLDDLQEVIKQSIGGYNVDIEVTALVKSSKDSMSLFMLLDALTRLFPTDPINILLPYMPYARQDRVCNPGEALGVKVFSDLLFNTFKSSIARITVVDPHSDVTGAVFDNDVLKIISQKEKFMEFLHENEELLSVLEEDNFVLVAPDAGALKKTFDVAKELGGSKVICANKVRDTATGQITHTEVLSGDYSLSGKDVVIIDDICDGGRTFHELAKVLKEYEEVKSVHLYVTHGIFSKGIDFSEFIDKVYSPYNWLEDDNE